MNCVLPIKESVLVVCVILLKLIVIQKLDGMTKSSESSKHLRNYIDHCFIKDTILNIFPKITEKFWSYFYTKTRSFAFHMRFTASVYTEKVASSVLHFFTSMIYSARDISNIQVSSKHLLTSQSHQSSPLNVHTPAYVTLIWCM